MINIVQYRRIPFFVSAVLFVTSVGALIAFGLKPGIDFTGGSLVAVTYPVERPTQEAVIEAAHEAGIEQVIAQTTGEEGYILRMPFLSEEEHQNVLRALGELAGPDEGEDGGSAFREDRFEKVEPTISAELRSRALIAAVAVLLGIILYVAYTFRKVTEPVSSWKYGLIAIFTLVHDVLITMGVLAFLGRFLGVEIDIAIVVALLTILGYSVNDTIIVFDRVRENILRRGTANFAETVDISLKQTVVRSLNTSLTAELSLLAIFFFGGDSVHYFALTLIVGMFIGSYSSIFLASPLLVEFYNWQRRKAVK
jgi:preprotein translocase subunit SecF